jgi:probable F420-dependent oxidoreductase
VLSDRIRIAIQFHPQHGAWSDLRAAVVRAEELGVDIVYNWDHFFPLSGPADGEHFECWTMLGAFAEITERVDIGALVTCNSYRNPDLLADMARTVDHISKGRLILGIGAGWFDRDYEEYGYEFGTAGSRLAALADALPRINARWKKLNPPPTRQIPILIGGGGERKTLRIAAEHAQVWHGFGDANQLRHKNGVLDRWCYEIGRDPKEIERSVGANLRDPSAGDDLVAAGAQQITLGVDGRTKWDVSPAVDWLAWRDSRG